MWERKIKDGKGLVAECIVLAFVRVVDKVNQINAHAHTRGLCHLCSLLSALSLSLPSLFPDYMSISISFSLVWLWGFGAVRIVVVDF